MTDQSALTTAPARNLIPAVGEWATIMQLAGVLVKSGFLPTSIKTPEAATAIILKGRELGIPPMQAFSHIAVIQGKPACSSELQLALLARGGVTWTWEHDGSNGQATIVFHRSGYADVKGQFCSEDAKRAGLLDKDSWKKYGPNMLRARAISNGARMIGPDLLMGMSYTYEELGAEVNEDETPVTVETKAEVVEGKQQGVEVERKLYEWCQVHKIPWPMFTNSVTKHAERDVSDLSTEAAKEFCRDFKARHPEFFAEGKNVPRETVEEKEPEQDQ